MNKAVKSLILLAVLVLLAALPFYAGAYPLSLANTIMIFMVLALSWDMLLRSGQLSFGIAGFFGVGGYAAVLSQVFGGINPLLTILLAALTAGLMALILGLVVLQLRGLYFAIVTLALAEIFRVIVTNIPDLTGGHEGTILKSAIFAGHTYKTYWLVLAIAVGGIVASEVFQRSRLYFALTSIRNDELVAKSSGINVFKYLVIAFSITAAIQGLVGGAYAQIYGFVSPEGSFSVNFTLLPLAMAVFGGMSRTWGPVVGAVLLGLASEILKLYIPYGHLIVYGVIIVAAILFLPEGVVGLISKHVLRRS